MGVRGAPGALGALCVLVAAGCAATTREAALSVNGHHDPRTVGRVEVEGNEAFSDGAIVERLALRPPRGLLFPERTRFDALTLRLDAERVVAFYRERGYFSAEVVDFGARNLGENRVAIRFVVVEGEPTRIRSVRIRQPQGGPPAAADPWALQRVAGLEVGQVLRHPDYLRARDALRDALTARGHARAKVAGRVEIDRDARTADVRFELDPGRVARFGDVRVIGGGRVPESAVRARLAWSRGDRYDPAKLERTQANLYRLGVFSAVRLRTDEGTDGDELDLTIQVSEARRHEIRLGGGAALDQARVEARARAGYAVRSWLVPLTTLSLELRPGFVIVPGRAAERGLTGEALGSIRKDDFLWPLLALDADVAYELQVREAYATRGPRVEAGLERAFHGGRLRLRAAWNLEALTLVDDEPGVVEALGVDDPYRLAWIEQQGLFDGRDDPLDPRRGVWARLLVEEGGPPAGGRFTFARVIPEVRAYVPVAPRLVLAGYARLGRLLGDDSPFTRRFYGGGASGHRGFGFRRLSPMVRLDDRLVPIGADTLFESAVEARIDALRLRGRPLGVALFLDAGDAVDAPADLAAADLHLAAGLGLSYTTMAGPVRLDVGVRLNRTGGRVEDGVELDPDPGSRFAVHLNLGESF